MLTLIRRLEQEMKKGVESDTVACFAESIKLVLEVCYRSGSDDIEHEPTCRPVLSLPKEMLVRSVEFEKYLSLFLFHLLRVLTGTHGKTPLRVRKSECAEKNEYVVFELLSFNYSQSTTSRMLHSNKQVR